MEEYEVLAEATGCGAKWCVDSWGNMVAVWNGKAYPCNSLVEFTELCEDWFS